MDEFADLPMVNLDENFASPASSSHKRRVCRNQGRKIMSRENYKSISIISSLMPGQYTEGCLVCCSTPACCPCCSICPCCGESEYVKMKRKASTYIHIREHSIEWNEPEIVMQPGVCCGIDPCLYDVQDRVHVVYYDDVMFDRITDQTRYCNEFRTCCFGGRGERIRIDSPVCCGCCQRGYFPCFCVPMCCPKSCCPCMVRYELHVQDAQQGLHAISHARQTALMNDLYHHQVSKGSQDHIKYNNNSTAHHNHNHHKKGHQHHTPHSPRSPEIPQDLAQGIPTSPNAHSYSYSDSEQKSSTTEERVQVTVMGHRAVLQR